MVSLSTSRPQLCVLWLFQSYGVSDRNQLKFMLLFVLEHFPFMIIYLILMPSALALHGVFVFMLFSSVKFYSSFGFGYDNV